MRAIAQASKYKPYSRLRGYMYSLLSHQMIKIRLEQSYAVEQWGVSTCSYLLRLMDLGDELMLK